MRSPYTTFHRFQSTAYQPNTHGYQVAFHQDVVFTQSERFLHTDQLITRLQVVVMINFIRMLLGNVSVNVFKSDAMIWWAAIFRTPLIDVRQIAASVKVPGLCDEPREES